MKPQILLFALITSFCSLQAQVHNVAVTLNSSYTQQAFFKFGTDDLNIIQKTDWDLAFLRTSAYAFATRVNDAKIQVFEAPSTFTWETLDITNVDTWTQLYNSETTWAEGAFDKGSATYGWGEYNMANHHVVGTVIFVLKYDDNTIKKFMIEDYSSGYTCKFSTWNGSAWGADQTFTLPNTTGDGKSFNYYSLTNNAVVNTFPNDANWDLFFSQYYSFYNNVMMYKVTGALHKTGIKVAKKLAGDTSDPITADFSENINTIGDGWKQLSGFSYTIPDNKYFVKLADNTVYKMWFTAFGGTSTGNINFSYEDVTATLGTIDIQNKASFGIYPNPVVNKTATLVYEINDSNLKDGIVSIYNMTGQKVFEDKISNQSGFYSKELNLYNLNSGTYIVVFQTDKFKETKKIIVK